jgi:hypothetical protein
LTAVASLVESHPWFHDWRVAADYVHVERRGRVTVIRREETCINCARLRVTLIDAKRWEQIGRKRYKRNVKIVRLSKAEYVKRKFLETTSWSKKELERLGLAA